MAKFHGNIGFTEQYEKTPGNWTERIVEKEYFGEVISLSYNARSGSETTNDELTVNKRISIVANDYAFQNFHFMKFIVYMGVKWKITSVEPQYPRLILSMGGVYNAKSPNSSVDA
ncbi:MAG: hypothetical protein J6U54_09905 [Clostridiales bacterium]|nr:hypothetical protein [Clostridiales bacterium]